MSNIKKKSIELIAQLFVYITVFIVTAIPAYAEGSIWDQFSTYHSKETEVAAAQALSPFLKFVFFILAIITTIVIVVAVLCIGIKAGKVTSGKDSFSKKWVGTTSAVIVICILVGGGSWIKILKAGQQIVVDPATNILTNQQPAAGGPGAAPVVTPTPTPATVR